MCSIDIKEIADVVDLTVDSPPGTAIAEPQILLESIDLEWSARCNGGIPATRLYENSFSIELLLKFDLLWRRLFAASQQ